MQFDKMLTLPRKNAIAMAFSKSKKYCVTLIPCCFKFLSGNTSVFFNKTFFLYYANLNRFITSYDKIIAKKISKIRNNSL